MVETIIKEVYSSEETYDYAMELGLKLDKPMLICLDGELGAGKTVFAKGLSCGLGIDEDVVSSTFTLFNIYDESRIPFYHFDVYRIKSLEEMHDIGYEEYFFGNGVCLVEWASMIEELIPEYAVRVHIYKDLDKGADYRKIVIDNWEVQ